jgi:oligosaccharide repeat unit polymerase
MIQLLGGVIYVLIAALGAMLLRSHRGASPAFWLPLTMGLIALPTFALIDFTHPSDAAHVVAFLVAIGSFTAAALIYQLRFPLEGSVVAYGRREETPDSADARVMAVLLLAFCVGITIVYFILVGYNLLFLILAGTVTNYSRLRLSTYSGDTYFAPGYVNQFKNTLYPILAAALIVWLRGVHPVWRWTLGGGAALFGIFALLGTGQRVYILFAICTTIYGLYLLRFGKQRGIPLRLIGMLVVPALLLFAFMTMAYKQITDASAGEVVTEIFGRFVRVQHEGGLIGFRLFAEKGIVWFEEWLKGLVGILPGREGSLVAHEVHGEMYGTTQGTVPLSAVGSAYLNGGQLGVAALFAGFGLVCSYLYHRFLEGPRTVLRCLSYGALFFYLGTYVVGPPESLIDSGVVAIGGLLLLRRVRWLPRRASVGSAGRSTPPAAGPILGSTS